MWTSNQLTWTAKASAATSRLAWGLDQSVRHVGRAARLWARQAWRPRKNWKLLTVICEASCRAMLIVYASSSSLSMDIHGWLVYLPTWLGDFCGAHDDSKYAIHVFFHSYVSSNIFLLFVSNHHGLRDQLFMCSWKTRSVWFGQMSSIITLWFLNTATESCHLQWVVPIENGDFP